MVAIAVVAVMSGGTSSAQTALETTLAREEIDTQAEALRFIQSAHIAEKDDENGKFSKLWQDITNNALNIVGKDTSYQKSITQFSPNDCSDLYAGDNMKNQKAFFINTRALGGSDPSTAFVAATANPNLFSSASTYPRLIYGDDNNGLASSGTSQVLQRAEGIYVIGVKDPNTTIIAGKDGTQSAYYDFYIRTCWYGTGDQTPSTISTVIRLYDPAIVKDE